MDQPSLFMMGAAGAKTTDADKDKKKDMTAIADNRISDIQINQDKKRNTNNERHNYTVNLRK